MDLRRAFLDDVIAHPDEDAPRLIFADWLEENGDAGRAEFIRLQIARARESEGREVPATGRERDLLEVNRASWTEGLEGLADQVLFRRGLIEGLWAKTPSPGLRTGLSELCRAFPVRLLRLESPSEELLEAIVTAVSRNELRLEQLDIDLENDLTPGTWFETLLDLPQAAGVRSLLMEHENATARWNAVVARLAQPGPLNHLTELGIGFGTVDDPIAPAVIEAVIQSPHLPHLRKLHVPFSRFDSEAARTLGESPLRDKLTHLDLGCCHIPEAGWWHIVRGPNTPNLEWLGLIGGHVDHGDNWDSMREHDIGKALTALLGERADYTTSATFPRWHGDKIG